MGMIDAKTAKELLGCDDATLQQHVNSGAIKAQRQGGKLSVDEDDVQRLAKHEDDEGTIVLTGESDNLQIDLGKVVDDSSETIVQSKPAAGKDTQSITFGEELEVVSLEDNRTQDIQPTKPTTAAQGLSFTDSNTAVMTSVEETSVGNTTAPIETGPQNRSGPLPVGESGRRSVHSSRRAPEQDTPVAWYWFACMALTFALAAFFVAPYYVIATSHKLGDRDYVGTTERGADATVRVADDTIWTPMAGNIAGFNVEPDKTAWSKAGNVGEYKDIKQFKDNQADWRYQKYLDGINTPGERLESFVVVKLSDDGKKAISKVGGKEYPLVEKTSKQEGGAEIKVIEAQVWPEK